MKDVSYGEEARKDAEAAAKECQIRTARDRFENVRGSICSALAREVHGWIWGLEQMKAEVEMESSLSSDVKAWKKLIETYDALFELVQPRDHVPAASCRSIQGKTRTV